MNKTDISENLHADMWIGDLQNERDNMVEKIKHLEKEKLETEIRLEAIKAAEKILRLLQTYRSGRPSVIEITEHSMLKRVFDGHKKETPLVLSFILKYAQEEEIDSLLAGACFFDANIISFIGSRVHFEFVPKEFAKFPKGIFCEYKDRITADDKPGEHFRVYIPPKK